MNKNSFDGDSLLERLNWRYAVKKFDRSRKISEEDWNTLERSLIIAPTSFGLQLFKAIVITDDDLKQKLSPAAWGQPQIADCSHLVVLAAKKTILPEDVDKFFERVGAVRKIPADTLSDSKKRVLRFGEKAVAEGWAFSWCQRQTYLVLGFLLETAALLGIDACPMEGFDPAQFDNMLRLEDYSATVLCAVGYRSESDRISNLPKVRMPNENLIERISAKTGK